MRISEQIHKELACRYELEKPLLAAQTVGKNEKQAFCVVPQEVSVIKSVVIEPHKGIGSLQLGMTPEQILVELCKLCQGLHHKEREIQITKDTDGHVMRYMVVGLFLFLVTYKENHATEIAIDYELSVHVPVTLYGIHCYQITAENLVERLKLYDSFSCDEADIQLGTTYTFEKLGIVLWREHAFHPKLLEDEKYMAEMDAVLEDEYSYWYFQMITVKSSV